MTSRRAPLPVVDIVIDSPPWKSRRGVKGLIRHAITEASSHLRRPSGELAVLLTDDATIQGLNRTWRHKDEPTNVLSFPANVALGDDASAFLGDIAIAYETTEREAKAEGKRFADHLAHLAIHGFLHLLGYDHETDSEAEAMEALEISLLERLGIPNPYIARDAKG